jgi:hypothetical protein
VLKSLTTTACITDLHEVLYLRVFWTVVKPFQFLFLWDKLLYMMTCLCFVCVLLDQHLNFHLHLCSMLAFCMYTISVTSWTNVQVMKIIFFFLHFKLCVPIMEIWFSRHFAFESKLSRGVHKFARNISSYLKIPGIRKVTWNKFHTEDPQILCATVLSLFAWTTWCLAFVQPWLSNNAIIVRDRNCIYSCMVTRIFAGVKVL